MIGTLNENTLHSQLKSHYCPADAQTEYKMEAGYIADIFCFNDEKIIEIQTAHFSNMKNKLEKLTKAHHVELIYPISINTYIRTLNEDASERSLNKSPLHGSVFQICEELTSISNLFNNKNLSLRLVFIESITTKIDDKKGRSRYKKPRIIDKELIKIIKEECYPTMAQLVQSMLDMLPETFTTEDIKQRGYKKRLGYVIWFYKSLKLIEECGKKERRKIYKKIKF